MFTFMPFALIFSYFGTGMTHDTTIPNWVFAAQGFAFLTYRLLDEMDGKQARRTGNSGPLGLLFDHGCDAYSMGFIIMVAAKFLKGGDGLMSFWLVAGSLFVFHFTTLEEYYVGGLYLGHLNGVTDGSFGVMAILFSLGIFGPEFLDQEFVKDGGEYLTYGSIMIELAIAMFLFSVVSSLKNIVNKDPQETKGEAVIMKPFLI